MKAEARVLKDFRPVELTLTFETLLEATTFRELFNCERVVRAVGFGAARIRVEFDKVGVTGDNDRYAFVNSIIIGKDGSA